MKVTLYRRGDNLSTELPFDDVDEIALLDSESHGPKPAEFTEDGSQKLLLVFPANVYAIKVERA